MISPLTLQFAIQDLSQGLCAVEKALIGSPSMGGKVVLKDGHRQFRVQRNGLGQHGNGMLIVDDALEFAIDGDPLWAFTRFENETQ